MITEFRTYRCAADDVDRVVARLHAAAFPILRDVGARTVGPWITPVAQGPGVYYVLHWDDLDAMTDGWRRFREDPRWKAAAEPPISIEVTSQLLDSDSALHWDRA